LTNFSSENTWYLLILALKLAQNKAINKTEGFVNNKANTFLNFLGGIALLVCVRLTKV
jgi:hypothetical protein